MLVGIFDLRQDKEMSTASAGGMGIGRMRLVCAGMCVPLLLLLKSRVLGASSLN